MALPEPSAKPRGRRPDPAKRRAVFEAARDAFFELGYGASMDAIAARAGVSKQTIYNQFASKEELFAAAVAETSAAMIAPLNDHTPDATPAQVLTELARQYMEIVLSERSAELIRTLAAQRQQFPEIVQAFYRSGPANTLGRTAAYLAEETAHGRLAVRDPVLAAEQFFGMLAGPNHLRLMLGIAGPPVGVDRERRIAACVEAFLKAHGA